MKAILISWCAAAALPVLAQTAPPPAVDPWAALAFLEGTWGAKSTYPEGVAVDSAYLFRRELHGHVLARRAVSAAACSGPATFDCEHSDELIVYQELPGQPLKALYVDNEGHVIHYVVSTPAPNDVVFLSEGANGPRFRLEYKLDHGEMAGKFQMQMPGQSDWHSYLEWSGTRR
jgi:hypothetical protein